MSANILYTQYVNSVSCWVRLSVFLFFGIVLQFTTFLNLDGHYIDKNFDELTGIRRMSLDELGVNLMDSRVALRSSLPLQN